ncbi:MAG: aminopeptidase, partial [Muribaculaceae bacterium]|nr:aminopeptidase [Muribaculaceae bacterium]
MTYNLINPRVPALALIAAAASAFAAEPAPADSLAAKADSVFVFTDLKVVPHTSVKDQNKSGTCWCFAGTSFFENEILRKTGKEVDLSQMFTVRHCYDDKAQKYQRMGGTINFAQGGSIMDVPYVWKRYGAVPLEAYQGLEYGEAKHDHYEMADVLTSYMQDRAKPVSIKLSPAWKAGLN